MRTGIISYDSYVTQRKSSKKRDTGKQLPGQCCPASTLQAECMPRNWPRSEVNLSAQQPSSTTVAAARPWHDGWGASSRTHLWCYTTTTVSDVLCCKPPLPPATTSTHHSEHAPSLPKPGTAAQSLHQACMCCAAAPAVPARLVIRCTQQCFNQPSRASSKQGWNLAAAYSPQTNAYLHSLGEFTESQCPLHWVCLQLP